MSSSGCAVAGFLALFWGLVLLGGAVEPGYSHVEDYVSRLASFGAAFPVVGILAIAALATAHGATALGLGRSGARAPAGTLGVAAIAGYVVAALRVHCPGGAAGCAGTATAPDSWTDAVHAAAVLAYEVALLAAMLTTAGWAARRRRRALAAMSLVAAAASLVSVLRIEEPAAGADQRLWLAVSCAWLLSVGFLSRPWAPDRAHARWCPAPARAGSRTRRRRRAGPRGARPPSA